MSDIFDAVNRRNIFESAAGEAFRERQHRYRTRENEALEKLGEREQEYLRFREQGQYRYMLPLDDEDLRYLETVEETGALDDGEVYNQAASMAIARRYDIPSEYVRENLEAFLAAEDIDTTKKLPRTWYNALTSRFRRGYNSIRLGKLGSRLLEEEAFGDTPLTGPLLDYAQAIQEENRRLEYGEESMPKNQVLRFIQEEVAGGFLESAPYTAYVMGASALGSLIGGKLAGGQGAKLGGKLGGFAAGLEIAAGQEYIQLRGLVDPETGKPLLDKDLARNTALLTGVVSAFVETALWDSFEKLAGAAGAAAGKDIAGSFFSRIVNKVLVNLHAKGFLYHIAKMGITGLERMTAEGGEEFFQELSTEVGRNVALEFQKERVLEEFGGTPEERDRLIEQLNSAKTTASDVLHNAFEAFKGSAAATLFSGLPETVLNYRADFRNLRYAKTTATFAASLEEYKKLNEKNPLFEGVKDAAIEKVFAAGQEAGKKERAALEELEKANQEAMKESGRLAPAEAGPLPTKEAPAPARRVPGGGLYTQIKDRQTDARGFEEARLSIGDPYTGAYYGGIGYRIDGDELIIDSVEVEGHVSDRTQVIREAVLDLAGNYRGADIEWNPTEPGLMDIRDEIIAGNPLGKDKGLQWFLPEDNVSESIASAPLRNALRGTFLSNASEAEVRTAARLVSAIDRTLGIDTASALNKDLIAGTREDLLKNPAMERILSGEDNGGVSALDRHVAGGTFFVRDGQQVSAATAAKEFGQGIKAVIFATEKADFSTFAHEFFHFVDVAYIGRNRELRTRFEDALDKHYDDFTEEDREYLARSFERYLKDGTAPNRGLEKLFKQIARAMARAWNAVKDMAGISPRLKDAFDALLAGGESPLAQETAQEAAEAAASKNAPQGTRKAQEGPETVTLGKSVAGPLLKGEPPAGDGRKNVLYQLAPEDREHAPTEALIERAMAIADEEARERVIGDIRRLRALYAGTTAEFKAPNGKTSNLLEALGEERGQQAWYAVRTAGFKEWFGDWEAAQLIRMAEEVWNGGTNAVRFNFTPSGKLKNEVKKLTGHSLENIVITDSDIRHIKKEHGQNQSKLGQVDVTPEDIALIPLVMNDFDEANIRATINTKDGKQISKLDFKKQINGMAVFGSVELYPEGTSQQAVTLYIKKSKSANVVSPTPAANVQNAIAQLTIQQAKDLRNALKNSSRVVDENGEPLAVYHGTNAEFDIFNQDNSSYFFADDRDYAEALALEKGGERIETAFLNIQNPLVKKSGHNQFSLDTYENPVISRAKENGHDGVFFVDERTGLASAGTFYVAFSPEQIKSATDNAGSYDGDNPSILFQLIGEPGAAALDNAEEATVRMDNLAIARQLEGAGKDAKAVRLATGWERGADRKWRYEIPDGVIDEDIIDTSVDYRYKGTLHDLYKDKTLFEAYPALKDVKVQIAERVIPWLPAGAYDAETNTISVFWETEYDKQNINSVLIHEIQHFIQEAEGFARGSNYTYFESRRKPLSPFTGELKEWDEEHSSARSKKKFWDWLPDKVSKIKDPELKEFVKSYKNGDISLEQFRERIDYELWDPNGPYKKWRYGAADQYQKTAGEVEARNAAFRAGLSPQQRLETLLAETEDVAREDQIFLYDSMTAMAMVEDPQALRENAVVPRDARTLTEAEEVVKNSETGFLNKPLTNRLFNITATISGKSLDEMTNEKLTKKAVSPRLQAKAVANADVLFERAVIHTTHEDIHKRKEVAQVHRFGTLMEDNGSYIPVKLTVIEYKAEQYGTRIYAIEAVDIEKMKSAGLLPQPRTNPENSGPIADFNKNLLRLSEIVNTQNDIFPLFQLSADAIRADARRFSTPEAWKESAETDALFGLDPVLPEGVSGEEADAWYRTTWEEAWGIRRDEQGNEIQAEVETLTTEEIDTRFIDEMVQEEKLDGFLKDISRALDPDNWRGSVQDEAEAAKRDAAYELASRIRNEMHPTVINNANRVGGEKALTLSPSARKSILTLMEKGARHYRYLYTEITRSQAFAALAEKEIRAGPEIQDPRGRVLSIVDRGKMALAIKNKEIQQRLLSGELVPDAEVRQYIDSLLEDRRALRRKLALAEENVKEDWAFLNEAEKRALTNREELKKTEETIGDYALEIERLEIILDRVKSKAKTDRKKASSARETQTRLEKTRKNLSAARERLAELKEEYRDFVKSARSQAVMDKQAAVTKLKKELRALAEERRAAQKVLAYKKNLVDRIMKMPSKQVWYEQRRQIRAIQQAIDPSVRRAKVLWEGELYDIQEFRDKAIEEGLAGVLPKRLITRIFKKSINEWTVAELEEMRNEVDRLAALGRIEWRGREDERAMALHASLNRVIDQNLGNKKYQQAFAVGSKEWKKQLRGLNSIFRKVAHESWNLARIAQWIDGDREGANFETLVVEERRVYAEKMNHIDRRQKRIFDYMKKLGIEVRDLYDKEYTLDGIGPLNGAATFTVSDLMYMYIGLRNRDTRDAIIFGNMLDVRERSFYDSEALREQVGPPKLAALSAFVNKTLTAKEKALAEEIGHDFRDEFGRLNDIFANEFNRVMKQVGAYVPMIRQDVIASGSAHENQQGAEFLNVAGYSLRRNTEKGFSIERIKTGAKHQTAIKLDMFGSWMAAVERQEHFAAYYPYIRKLNGVYKTRSEGSAVVQDQISRIYGTETLNRVKAKINALANPQSFRDDTNINNLLRLLRGNVAVASLAFNLPSVLKQFAASPMPFLAHVNALEYAGRAVEFIRNPKEFSDRVRGKSAIMRHRSGSVMLEEFRRAQETNRGKKGLSVIQKIGMKGLEIADWTSVVIGWDAVYQKALAGGLSEEEAVEKADNITLKTQPSGREQDLPDLFVNQPEAMKIITQFTTSLSSIWGQLTYDLPAAVRNRQWGYVLSMVFAYALAGWGIGAVTEAAKVLIYGKDEDDEDAWKRIFLYGSFSQALDSVPLLGGEISAIAEQAITGKKRRMYTSPLMPAAESLIEAAAKATSGDWNKAAQNLAEAAAFGFGGPVSASKQVYRIVTRARAMGSAINR